MTTGDTRPGDKSVVNVADVLGNSDQAESTYFGGMTPANQTIEWKDVNDKYLADKNNFKFEIPLSQRRGNRKYENRLLPIHEHPPQARLDFINRLLDLVDQKAKKAGYDEGYLLSAAFDLLVAAEYISYGSGRIFSGDWLVCDADSNGETLLLTPFVNACPRCSSHNRFFYLGHIDGFKSFKLESGSIGKITRESLCSLLASWLRRKHRNLEIYYGKEPFDVIIKDEAEKTVVMAEVKSAPLVTPPLAVVPGKNRTLNTPSANHGKANPLSDDEVFLFIPKWDDAIAAWGYRLVSLGTRGVAPGDDWAYNRITLAISDSSVFDDYVEFWLRALKAYSEKSAKDPIYWLTGGSGAPSDPSWTSHMGTISDSKTSVGLDRTDDIKKGIYQVIKARYELADSSGDYTVKTAIISNAHSIRHGTEYIDPVKNVNIFFYEPTLGESESISPEPTPAYKLYDEIVTFTEKLKGDEWMCRNFDW